MAKPPKILCKNFKSGEFVPQVIRAYGKIYIYFSDDGNGRYCYQMEDDYESEAKFHPLGAGGGGSHPPPKVPLILFWDNISNVPVANASSVSDWNTFFDLPANGTPFASVVVSGNKVFVYGGNGITLIDSIFEFNDNLLGFFDNANCITKVGGFCFDQCNFLQSIVANAASSFGDGAASECPVLSFVSANAATTFGDECFTDDVLLPGISAASAISFGEFCFGGNLGLINFSNATAQYFGVGCFQNCNAMTSHSAPSATQYDIAAIQNCTSLVQFSSNATKFGNQCFSGSTGLQIIKIPSCQMLGSTTGDNQVFELIIGNTITLTIPTAIATDGDVVWLQAHDTVTLILV